MTGYASALTSRQAKAIAMLLLKPGIAQAAEAVPVGERTLRRWLAKPEFKAEIEAESRRLLDRAQTRARAATDVAVAALIRNCGDAAPAAVQVQAAARLLEHQRNADLAEIERRLIALEERQEQRE